MYATGLLFPPQFAQRLGAKKVAPCQASAGESFAGVTAPFEIEGFGYRPVRSPPAGCAVRTKPVALTPSRKDALIALTACPATVALFASAALSARPADGTLPSFASTMSRPVSELSLTLADV